MAFTVTETAFYRNGGSTPGTCVLTGTVVASAGTSSGDLLPGNQTVGTSLSDARALRKIIRWGITSATDENAIEVVLSYDATHDGDKLTLDFTADETLNWWIEGYDGGE